MSEEYISKGIALCVNCVPESIDVNIKYFWEELALSLRDKGFFLLVVTTAELNSSVFQTIKVPYNIIDFNGSYDNYYKNNDTVEGYIVSEIMRRYRCDEHVAKKSLQIGSHFYKELVAAISPAVVIGWQSTDINTFLLRKCTSDYGIPFWSGERGLLKNTLMFDLGDNYSSSEVMRSFTIDKLYRSYQFTEELISELQEKYILTNPSGKYDSANLIDNNTFRTQQGIPYNALVIVLFFHAEPGIASSYKDSRFLEINGADRGELLKKITSIINYCEANGIYLIVQDHPLNKFHPEPIVVQQSHYIRQVEENIHTLLRTADCSLHTLSTIQYDSIFYEKRMGLLSKSMLSMKNGAYQYDDYFSVEEFMSNLLSESNWPSRLNNLKKKLCFIYEYFLIKNDDKNRKAEAERVSELLAFYESPVNNDAIDKINDFLQRWS